MTIAKELFSDPRLKKIKKELLSLVSEYRERVEGIIPPKKELESAYDEEIETMGKLRGQKLWFPYLGSGLGRGSYVELADGSIKLDFITGIGPQGSGHSAPQVIETMIDAAIEDTVMQGNLQQNEESLLLAKKLSSLSGFPHCFLSTSGAMANENALKVVFQKRAPAQRIIAFERCFAGRTLALSQITDKPSFREGLPTTIFVDYVPFFQQEDPEKSLQVTLTALERILQRYPSQHAVMILELVQGEGGFYPGEARFFTEIAKLLSRHEIPIMADEIQTFGRTPSLFAFHYYGLTPYIDICTTGKLSLVTATLFSEKMNPRPGLLSQTFTSTTGAIRTTSLFLDWLTSGPYFGEKGRIAEIFTRFAKGLQRLQEEFPGQISGPFGLGAMIAFTFRKGDQEETKKLNQNLFHNGLITFVAGSFPTRIRMLPPLLVVTDEEIDEAFKIIAKTLREF